MRWFKHALVPATVILALTATACTGGNNAKPGGSPAGVTEAEGDPQGKYSEPVTVNLGFYTPAENQWPEGSNDTLTDNRYTRLIKERFNIDIKYAFEVPQSAYDQKVSLLVSSNDIPDFLFVNLSDFNILAESEMLEDLTEIYEKYASPLLKDVISGFGPDFIRKVTYKDKLYGIPSTVPAHDNDNIFWIRTDWLEKVGIELDKVITIDDLEKVARAFIEEDPDGNGQKDTYGIQSQAAFFTGTTGYNSLDGIFTAHKAFPKIWIKDDKGEIVYGSTRPEVKEALGKLQDWYAQGLIDREFGTLKSDQVAKDISAGKAGMATGYSWAPAKLLADSVKNDPTAEWDSFILAADDGKWYNRQPNPMGRIMVVKKGTRNPEAIVKLINLFTEMDNNIPGSPKSYHDSPSTNWQVRPVQRTFRVKSTVVDRFQRFQDAAAGKITKDDLPESDVNLFEQFQKGWEELKKDPAEWAYILYQFNGGATILNPANVEVYSEFYGLTKSMETRWANLTKLENEAFLRIIVGDKPLDYFDTFVEEWHRQGGDIVTKEVREEVARLNN
ncbi:extracellular solute-binding protein [Paenibacillus sp. J2TS4]|uniref:extracellular solute-binding protein n=1 Tax=Paenibacillus sp. J2TS4 TaxID=2807194 RepID=UPI001B2B799A|nr:extracellular solute-binding protein [Paenibacillus sp. J2TS4]GIP34662.1 sugar ABC transporter substrate-binding protein [Paenibacillus sp. J2TS4]